MGSASTQLPGTRTGRNLRRSPVLIFAAVLLMCCGGEAVINIDQLAGESTRKFVAVTFYMHVSTHALTPPKVSSPLDIAARLAKGCKRGRMTRTWMGARGVGHGRDRDRDRGQGMQSCSGTATDFEVEDADRRMQGINKTESAWRTHQ